jgi:hypothetical protein
MTSLSVRECMQALVHWISQTPNTAPSSSLLAISVVTLSLEKNSVFA